MQSNSQDSSGSPSRRTLSEMMTQLSQMSKQAATTQQALQQTTKTLGARRETDLEKNNQGQIRAIVKRFPVLGLRVRAKIYHTKYTTPEVSPLGVKLAARVISLARGACPTPPGAKTGSSRYGKEFDQHLRDHGVYMNNRKSKPLNTEEARISLKQSRASLSPSQFTEEQFETFQRKNEDVVFESDVMADVIPIISGSCRIPSKQNVLFTELEPLTTSNAVRPKPDHFDGADLADLSVEVRNDDEVRQRVIPTNHASVPVAANFFIEAKGPDGNASVAQRQACYDGAYGARAMHTLQNYGTSNESYDGKAYTYSSTYHPATGTLQLYAHLVTAPTETGGRPEYHMTQLDTWGMTGNIQTFRRGATAFRNARDLARSHRDQFIHAANWRHASQDAQQNDENGLIANDSPQEQTANACGDNLGEDPKVYDAPQSLPTEDDTPNPSQASTILAAEDQGLSFATSFTSSSGNGPPVGSKRARQLSSPTNSWGRSSSKSRTRTNISELNKELSKKGQVEVPPCLQHDLWSRYNDENTPYTKSANNLERYMWRQIRAVPEWSYLESDK
ncbi:hypothetical protein VFPPC_10506 [Pochonia chlamydosporia 170]|uniref:Uncharacterized protein n=1 Tax=Pochonia chlamydosporia 170 TaxID=1380566 RepID=A0A179F1W5_METCM|nr:hypothetical protein VFPPC_10506 [Pochonia chlamydosporia 170]OAQ59447.1 hypothetical protein VFPPC_10506 [Pochonia chlamydosporia 170]